MKREVDLHPAIWALIDQCLRTGLYGDTVSDAVLSLMRSGGLEQAARIGVIDVRAKSKKGRKKQ